MALNDIVQVLQQISFLAAVLAGFSVTLLIGLLSTEKTKSLVAAAAASALVAAVFLGITTITGVSGVISAILDPGSASGPANQSTVYGAYSWTSISFLLGMFAFFVSLGFSGWVRSRRFGLLSSAVAASAVLVIVYFLVFVVRAF